MCPHCGQNAPVVYRGVVAHCTACGAARPPLTGSALQLAGQPSRIGGVLARALGWVVLLVGCALALAVGAGVHLLVPGIAGFLVGAPIAVMSIVVGTLLLRGGARLDRSGVAAEKDARTRALFALAAHRGGRLTASDVARALDLGEAAAEGLLASLAKEEPERVAVDVDAQGALVYLFDTGARARIDPEIARSPNREAWERLEAEEAAKVGSRSRAPR